MPETKAVYRVTPDNDYPPEAARGALAPLATVGYWQAQAATAIRMSEALGAERDAAQAEVARLRARIQRLEHALGATLRALEPVVYAQEHPGPPFVATPLDAAYDSGRRALTGERL